MNSHVCFDSGECGGVIEYGSISGLVVFLTGCLSWPSTNFSAVVISSVCGKLSAFSFSVCSTLTSLCYTVFPAVYGFFISISSPFVSFFTSNDFSIVKSNLIRVFCKFLMALLRFGFERNKLLFDMFIQLSFFWLSSVAMQNLRFAVNLLFS